MNRIRELREQSGVSQADLYRRLGWRQSRLANYEAGKRTPSLKDAREIVVALNFLSATCSLDQVFPDQSDDCAEELPTLSQKIPAQSHHQKVGGSAVQVSSTSQASP
ncbi:helix-turn-helix transcriptional regulator [Pseudomonas petrae]|uniref:helix-turn-helix transcriptional regulator n=1 Tax=Pseudomonas petrae TaxID=2912190 RepID=UPI003AFF9650